MKILKICMAVILLIIVTVSVNYLPDAKETITDADQPYCVIVDAGHGGKDPGKVGVNGELEKNINLEIAFELQKQLEALGMKVLLTRTDDCGLYSDDDTNKKAADMKKRCEFIAENSADVVVSVHQNSFTDSSVKGTQVFYYTHSANGKKLASYIREQIINNTDKNNNRPIKADDSYYMLINTSCPTVIVECGFLSNSAEAERLCDSAYQQILAKAIGLGVLDFLESND